MTDKPGRNDPCSCGSGKKYKKCCWLTDRAQAIETREETARIRQMARSYEPMSERRRQASRQEREQRYHQVADALLAEHGDDPSAQLRGLGATHPAEDIDRYVANARTHVSPIEMIGHLRGLEKSERTWTFVEEEIAVSLIDAYLIEHHPDVARWDEIVDMIEDTYGGLSTPEGEAVSLPEAAVALAKMWEVLIEEIPSELESVKMALNHLERTFDMKMRHMLFEFIEVYVSIPEAQKPAEATRVYQMIEGRLGKKFERKLLGTHAFK